MQYLCIDCFPFSLRTSPSVGSSLPRPPRPSGPIAAAAAAAAAATAAATTAATAATPQTTPTDTTEEYTTRYGGVNKEQWYKT